MPISGDELRDARHVVNRSQSEIADELGVSVRTIGNWESAGVPERAERRVMRLLGRIIISLREEAQRTAEYERWLQTEEGQASLERQLANFDSREEPHAQADVILVHGQRRGELMQRAIALEAFDDLDLLHELIRRRLDPEGEELRETKEFYAAVDESNVGTPLQDDDASDEDIDVDLDTEHLSHTDMALAAQRGRRKTDQPHAE